MMRQIIEIDEALCDGCGLCAGGCPEGALRIVDGKARLVGELLCDGLGACIGNCPRGAIRVEKREAEPYDEEKVLDNIIPQGKGTLVAHLEHLEHHGQESYLKTARAYLSREGIEWPLAAKVAAGASAPTFRPVTAPQAQHHDQHHHGHHHHGEGGCPGSRVFALERGPSKAAGGNTSLGARGAGAAPTDAPSELGHWPVQLMLANPRAPHYRGAELLLAADCTAFALGGFHGKLLAGKALAIACPKLDPYREEYVEKLRAMIDEAEVASITVAIMEVPCCGGLLALAKEALARAARKVELKKLVVTIGGEIMES